MERSNSFNGTNNTFKVIAVVLAIAVASTLLVGCLSGGSGSTTSTIPTITTGKVNTGETTTTMQKVTTTIASMVPDGTYTNLEQYSFHSGVNTVNITVTVQNDVVTVASVAGINVDPYSQNIIDNFNAALPGVVVGQKIEAISLPYNVAGSSLTSAAFQAYISSIVSTNGHPT